MKKIFMILICALAFSGCILERNYPKDSNEMYMPSSAYMDRGADPHVEAEVNELNQ